MNNEAPFAKIKRGKPVLRTGTTNSVKRDLYYYVLESSWPRVFVLFFSFYLFSNLAFALFYYIIPNALLGKESISFMDSFYFSVQTMATIGYGALSPQGHLANLLVTIEAAFGLIGVAVITGLVFAKISKPHAKIRFSKNIIISPFEGVPCLSFRIGNLRGNDIVEANISVSALIDEVSPEGQRLRRIYDLKLKRSYTPFFNLTWSLFHPIDEDSPLKNFESIKDNLQAISVTVTGHDGTFSTTVYSRHLYYPEDFSWGSYFKDIITTHQDGSLEINYHYFDDIIQKTDKAARA
jgi:inward rectifier potassium channel